jgi:hypothetical protein
VFISGTYGSGEDLLRFLYYFWQLAKLKEDHPRYILQTISPLDVVVSEKMFQRKVHMDA